MQQLRFFSVALVTSMLIAGCGRSSEEPSADSHAHDDAAQAPATAPAGPPPAQPRTESAFSVDDIDRWQRGLQAEITAVQDAGKKLAEAKDDNAKLEALNASLDTTTIDAGAAAAGVDRDRYRRLRNTFSDAVGQLSPIGMEMDVKQMPPQMVEQMQQAREASAEQIKQQLPAEVFEALKLRAGELRTLDKTLVGERLKVANAAR